MKLSKKAEYGLRAILAMCRAPAGTNFSIQELSTHEHIPLKFLEQILLILKNGGLLRSKRGIGGGYQLQRAAASISLGDVITLIDGSFDPIPCASAEAFTGSCACGIPGSCALGQTMAILRQEVNRWLAETTMAQILERERRQVPMAFEI